MSEVLFKCKKAARAARFLGVMSTKEKNSLLEKMGNLIIKNKDIIIGANNIDIKKGEDLGMSKTLLDRLRLTEKRICVMVEGLEVIKNLQDPIGEVIHGWTRPNGLIISKKRVPIGVIGIIYEARPNVTVDAAGLALKSGNAVILRGSSSALNSNKAIVEVLQRACIESGVCEDIFQLIEEPRREAVNELMKMKDYVDLLIPRGGAGLIQTVVKGSTVPVIETGVGNCHVYIDKDADLDKSLKIAFNSKVQRPSVCNAAESLLVHEAVAREFLPKIFSQYKESKVIIKGCPKAREIDNTIEEATEEDFNTEFLDLIIAIKVVKSLEEAIEHIYKYGTKHTEAIVTENISTAKKFCDNTDASSIMVNASTRFTDGGEFGFGAEMGISTQKMHARGPMGLNELTTIKYIVQGEGQIRE